MIFMIFTLYDGQVKTNFQEFISLKSNQMTNCQSKFDVFIKFLHLKTQKLLTRQMSLEVTKPATIVFQPLSIESGFQRQFAVQIAFYRSTSYYMQFTDEKVQKTDQIKLTQPQKTITFNPKESVMKLRTTLNYCERQDRIQNKILKLQIVYKIDGIKDSLQKDIDVAQYYLKNQEMFTIKITNKPETLLKYKVHIIFKEEVERVRSPALKQFDKKQSENQVSRNQAKSKGHILQNQAKSLQKPILVSSKSLKLISFQDNQQILQKGNNHLERQISRRKYVTVIIPEGNKPDYESENKIKHQTLPPTNDTFSLSNQNKKLEQKVSEIQKQLSEKSKQLSKIIFKHTQLESKYKQLGSKYKKLSQEHRENLAQKSTVNSNSAMQSSADLKKEKEKYEKLEKQFKKEKQKSLQNQKNLENKQDQIKKLQSEVKLLNQQVKKQQTLVKSLKLESSQFEQLLLQTQKRHQKGGSPLQESLKPYKQRIRMLERQKQDLQEENNFSQKQTKTKNEQNFELRQKIKSFNEQNLRNLQEISNTNYKLEKQEQKLKQLQIELKNTSKKSNQNHLGSDIENQGSEDQNQGNYNKFKSEKVIGGASGSSVTKLKAEINQLKTKLAISVKNLQNKQNLLKKFDAFSKEGKKQVQQELEQMKKQNSHLKQKLSSLQSHGSSGKNNQLSQLESKMQLQKLRKQMEYKTKSERQLLIDKSQMQSRNKTLQQDVVRSKQSIANILNVIHEFGDEGLIQDVNSFLG